MLFADTGTVLGVPDPSEGGYNPYDEQRMLELEDGEGGEPYDPAVVSEDILLSSGGEEEQDTARCRQLTEAPRMDTEPPADSATVTDTTINTAGSKATGTYTGPTAAVAEKLHSTGTYTRSGEKSKSSVAQNSANTKDSVQLPSEYLANKHATRLRNGARSLHDGSEIFRVENGTFFNEGDNRSRLCSVVFDREKKYNVSYSFDPVTLKCACCQAQDKSAKKTAYILSDQNFPAILPSNTASGACLKIIRIEGGTLAELATLFIDKLKGGSTPPGSVVLLGSATHLATVGSSGYAEDFVEASLRIGAVLHRSSVVAAAPMVLLDGSRDPALIRSIVEISAWLEIIFDKIAGFSGEAHRAVVAAIGECGKGGYQDSYSMRVRFPSGPLTRAKTTWASPSLVSLPENVEPLSLELEKKIVGLLLLDLNQGMALDLDTSPNHTRMVEIPCPGGAKRGATYIVVGSSHASRTAAALREAGEQVMEVIIPAWRPTTGQISSLKLKLEDTIKAVSGSYCTIFEFFDNCFYYAQFDDGSLTPARRGHDGRYHVDGDSIMAPKEMQYGSFKKVMPILEAAKGDKRILVPPIPRYLHNSCCADPEHVPNLKKESYKEDLINSVFEARSNIKDFSFRQGLRNIKVISPWNTIKHMENVWGVDPVHMNKHAYGAIAKLTLEAAAELTNKRKPQGKMEAEAKRPREERGYRGGGQAGPSNSRDQQTGAQPHRGGYWDGGRGLGRGYNSTRGQRGNRRMGRHSRWQGW